jgi:hypothetical protein
MPGPPSDTDDFDTPWKRVLAHYFEEFLAFYFPDIHAAIDWQRPYRLLDKELAQATRTAAIGRRVADMLVRVHTAGGEQWVLIHVEVQSSHDSDLAERMFVYNYRIYDQHRQPVASLAVLGDEAAAPAATSFGYSLFGCEMRLNFRTTALHAHAGDIDALLAQDNPFAIVTAAHVLTQQTRSQPALRYAAKWRLMQLLYARHWDRRRIMELFHVIDWMMRLPAELEGELLLGVSALQRRTVMTYVPRGIRAIYREARRAAQKRGLEAGQKLGLEQGRERGIEQGLEQGLERGLERGLEQGLERGLQRGLEQGMQRGQASLLASLLARRFGELPEHIQQRVAAADTSQIERWAMAALDGATLDELFPQH